MSEYCPYKNFSNYILRVPLLSFTSYQKFTSEKEISDLDFKKICKDPIIKEALFLASPELLKEIDRWLNKEIKDEKKIEKIKFSILKYFSRMTSRPTPFGLFAGCSVGNFGNETNIKLKQYDKNKRRTKLDMNYLVALSQDLIKNKKIRKQLMFFPNSSIYEVGGQIRYVEYKYFNTKRHHQSVGVDNTHYLDLILSEAKNGRYLEDLSSLLVNDIISIEEASGFIDELVSSQILVSELEPSVSGPEFLDQILLVLNKLKNVEDILELLVKVEQNLKTIDKKIGNNPKDYYQIIEILEKLETEFQPKFMFQTDMTINNNKNTINKKLITDLEKGLILFNKITLPTKNNLLAQFKDAFYERFENREVILSNALDVETGVGYKQNQDSNDINPLIDNIFIPKKKSSNSELNIKWTSINVFFQEKLINAFKNDSYIITLDQNDFKDYEVNWDDLPDTFSCMIEIIDEDGNEKIKFNGGGGSSAVNLISRFCSAEEEIYSLTKEILNAEDNINEGIILAEIVHLPESRVGNVLMKPDFRRYEIPYLAKSIKPKEQQLILSDLTISVKDNNEILLKSTKLNKIVIPRLTNAHNFSHNSLPIYHFLGDMQTQGKRKSLTFDLGPFSGDYDFLPRVEFGKLIIHDATWNLKKVHIEKMLKKQNSNIELLNEVKAFRKKLKIPHYVTLSDGDNQLLINFKNLTSIRMFLDIVSKRNAFKLVEFLFNNDGIVKRDNEYYTNQAIICFYNEKKLNNSKNSENK